MGIQRFFDKTLVQKRKASGTGHTVEGWTVISTFKGCLYPLRESDTIAPGSIFLRLNVTHKMHCLMDKDIKVGDKICHETDEYIVKRAPDWDKFYDALLSEVK